MTRKTHLVFAGILCAALTVPFILAATTSVSSGKQKVVVASKTVKVAGIPKKEDTFLTLKDLLALGMFLGTIVGAVWFLASKLGKIRTDMGSMKAELTERIITLSTEVQLLKQDVAALKEGLQQAHKSRQEIWKELGD